MKKYAVCAAAMLLAVALLGACAKRPDMGESGAATLGPSAATAPVTSSSTAATRPAETAVARPIAPSESRLQTATTPGAGSGAAGAGTQATAGPLQDIFFDFDKDAIREDQRAALDANVGWLKSRSTAKVTVEGHADERGTNEYNLALGDRRAKTTRDYLVSKGIESNRIMTVSYGEERPFVLGHDEAAWRWNRRVHFVLTAQ